MFRLGTPTGSVKRAAVRICTGFACIFICCIQGAGAADRLAVIDEGQVKAVYLYNFASFVEWPNSAFADSKSPIQYCSTAIGRDARALRFALQNEKVGDRPLSYRQLNNGESTEDCHVLYLKGLTGVDVQAVFERLDGRPVLTVSDEDGFANQGGVIELDMRDNRVRPIVNIENARQAHLQISSKLLRLAEVL